MSKLVSSVLRGLWVVLCNSRVLYIVTITLCESIVLQVLNVIISYTSQYHMLVLGCDPRRDSMYSSKGMSVFGSETLD